MNLIGNFAFLYIQIMKTYNKNLNSCSYFTGPIITLLEDNPQILITKSLMIFKLLRNFGHMIRNFGVNFRIVNVKICTEIENYLAEYCWDSLQRLSLYCRYPKILFENLQKPLQNVIAIKVHTSKVQDQDNIQFVNENNFPKLKHLFIYNGYHLENAKTIHFENIECFTLRSMLKFPFSFGNLKHLTLGSIAINDAFCEFVSNLIHLKTLRIMRITGLEESNSFSKMLELHNIQTDLVEMHFDYCKFLQPDSDAILRFLKQSAKLKKFSCSTTTNCEFFNYVKTCSHMFRTISSKLDSDWRFHVIYPYTNLFDAFYKKKCFVLERKKKKKKK